MQIWCGIYTGLLHEAWSRIDLLGCDLELISNSFYITPKVFFSGKGNTTVYIVYDSITVYCPLPWLHDTVSLIWLWYCPSAMTMILSLCYDSIYCPSAMQAQLCLYAGLSDTVSLLWLCNIVRGYCLSAMTNFRRILKGAAKKIKCVIGGGTTGNNHAFLDHWYVWNPLIGK